MKSRLGLFNHQIVAIGLPTELANGTIRFTLGRNTTKEELDITINELKNAVANLREASLQYEEFLKGQQSVQDKKILY